MARATQRPLECPNCGLLQVATDGARSQLTYCCRCKTQLAHCAGKSFDVTLASSLAILVLLIPAFVAPFLTTSEFGATRTSTLPMSSFVLWREGWYLLAIAVFVVLLVFPVARFAALSAVLGTVRGGHAAPPWAGRVFRLANALQTWAMLDVFLLGLLVAYARLHASLSVNLDVGAVCFIMAAVLSVIARAALDKAEVWRLILPDRPEVDPEADAHVDARVRASIACTSCGLLLPEEAAGSRCPRCDARVSRRTVGSLARAAALLLAAVLLYFPANLYPIATIPIDFKPTAYTVLGGVADLLESHLVGLALIVFTASFTIPILKMIGLAWCVRSAARHSRQHLVGKTHVYRVIEEVGRWSMVDPLTIACFVPVLHFNGLIDGRAEPAATPFAAVVILTTLAVKAFDPRLMWDEPRRSE